MNYKQKITNINYFANTVQISLTYRDWFMVGTWIELSQMTKFSGVSVEWFDDLLGLVIWPIRSVHREKTEIIVVDVPRELLRMLIFSIGRIAYQIDAKFQTSMNAQSILESISNQLKEQLNPEDNWFKCQF